MRSFILFACAVLATPYAVEEGLVASPLTLQVSPNATLGFWYPLISNSSANSGTAGATGTAFLMGGANIVKVHPPKSSVYAFTAPVAGASLVTGPQANVLRSNNAAVSAWLQASIPSSWNDGATHVATVMDFSASDGAGGYIGFTLQFSYDTSAPSFAQQSMTATLNAGGGINVFQNVGITWADGAWHHVVATIQSPPGCNSAFIAVWLDGLYTGQSVPLSTWTPPTGSVLTWGNDPSGQTPFIGVLADMRLYA